MTRTKRYILLLLGVNFLVSLLPTILFFYIEFHHNSQDEYYDIRTGEIHLWNSLRFLLLNMMVLFGGTVVIEIAMFVFFKIAWYLFGKKPR